MIVTNRCSRPSRAVVPAGLPASPSAHTQHQLCLETTTMIRSHVSGIQSIHCMGQRRLFYDARLLGCIVTGCRSSLIDTSFCCTHLFSLKPIFGFEIKKQKWSWIPFSFFFFLGCARPEDPSCCSVACYWRILAHRVPHLMSFFCLYSVSVGCNFLLGFILHDAT